MGVVFSRFICCALCVFTYAASAAHYKVSVPPRGEDKYKSADFSLWIPDGVKQVRAVIVHQHGCGRNGITVPYDLQWQALAKKHDAALMGSHLVPNDKCTDWHEPQNGSEHAFLAALKQFARQSNHPELESAPWCLWGHSGGAHWALAMTIRHPKRVVAAFPRSGGQLPEGELSPDLLSVPILFQLGAKENAPGNRFNRLYQNAQSAFVRGRENGALWAFAADPMSEHDTRQSRAIAIPYFDACLAHRLPKEGSALRALDPAKGVVASLDFAATAWLPDESVAARWKEFVATGTVKDTTPPPAPRSLKAEVKEGQLVLTWDAEVDLESGIKAFPVYRDGQKVGAVAGPEGARVKSFQAGNYGDEPEPVEPKMEYRAAVSGGTYEVTAVNHSDLESPRSERVAVKAP